MGWWLGEGQKKDTKPPKLLATICLSKKFSLNSWYQYTVKAGRVEHFSEVFEATNADAALAAGIFHRKEVPIAAVKEHQRQKTSRSAKRHS